MVNLRVTLKFPGQRVKDQVEVVAPEDLSHDAHADVVQAWLDSLGNYPTMNRLERHVGASITLCEADGSRARTFTLTTDPTDAVVAEGHAVVAAALATPEEKAALVEEASCGFGADDTCIFEGCDQPRVAGDTYCAGHRDQETDEQIQQAKLRDFDDTVPAKMRLVYTPCGMGYASIQTATTERRAIEKAKKVCDGDSVRHVVIEEHVSTGWWRRVLEVEKQPDGHSVRLALSLHRDPAKDAADGFAASRERLRLAMRETRAMEQAKAQIAHFQRAIARCEKYGKVEE